jgi:radical S-adenosyl methionine domain-containing protein 2
MDSDMIYCMLCWQVLPMEGQNDGSVEPLLISGEEFKAWVSRHRQVVEQAGVPLVEEGNDDMLGTYAMLDAENRCVMYI